MKRLLPLSTTPARHTAFAAQFALLVLCGCGGEPKFSPEHAVDAGARPTAFGSSQRERFGLEPMGGKTGAAEGAASERFEGDAPADWQLQPAREMRQLNYRVAGREDAECYLTVGVGGGLLFNVNRWCGQFGAEPMTEARVAALPRHVLLGEPAKLVELAGSFKGMGGAAARDDFAMLGLVGGGDDDLVTLKLVGPKAVVDAQRDAFVAFAASIRRVTGPAPGATVPAATDGGDTLRALTPPGWQEAPPAPMRNLNWRIAASPDAECYLTVGVGGGLLGNVVRWCGQFGAASMTAAQFAALPRHPLLGAPAALVELDGTFKGHDGMRLLGLVGGTDSEVVTLKLTGPKAIVENERATFLKLAASIQRGGRRPGATTPTANAPDPHAGDAAAPFEAVIPAGWTAVGDSGSKLLRHRFGTQGDCYVGMLGNDLPKLLGIWCGDMGAKAPDDAAIAALPKVPMLGGEAVLLDVAGDYKNMRGETIAGARALVAAVHHDGGVTFAKCIGPAAEVDAQRAAFLAFVASLKRTGQ